jgi:DNA polymerase III epsilon subunit-like protein
LNEWSCRLLNIDELERDWRDFEYAVVDLEGTGAQHREKEGIVEIAIVQIRNGTIINDIFRRLLDPEISIPVFISKIHGVYDKDVKGRPVFNDVKKEIEDQIWSRFLVGHNAAVDRRVLTFKMPGYQPRVTFDTLKMARALYGSFQKQGLGELIQRLGLDEALAKTPGLSGRHGASYDALATAHAFVAMIKENFPAGCTVRDLVKMGALDLDDASQKASRHHDTDQQQRNFNW